MPRRKLPIKKCTGFVIDASERAALDAQVENAINRETALSTLSGDQRAALVTELVHAIGFAKAGLADILAGKRARSAAWTRDILVKDVCDALQAAGVPTPMTARRDESLAQRLADDLAALAGLPDQGELFKQMQRARRIEKTVLPLSGKPYFVVGPWLIRGLWQALGGLWALGQWRVIGKGVNSAR